jgi:hypothetical protein
MNLKERIAAAKAEIEGAEPAVAPVYVGGELVDVSFRPVEGHVWADLMASCPPRPGSTLDGNVGFNSDAVAGAYPLTHVLVDGEPVDAEVWADLLSVIPSPSVKLVAAALWGLNQNDPAQRIAELGKARAGARTKKRRSPAS